MVPLGTPTRAADGSTVDRIAIAHGMLVTVPIAAIQFSEDVWGPDAKIFRPERWLTDDKADEARARELSMRRSLLAFFDGPRKCLGKAFALAEFKVRASVRGAADPHVLNDPPCFGYFWPVAGIRRCCPYWCATSRSNSVTGPIRRLRRRWRSYRALQSKERKGRKCRCVSEG